MYSKTSTTDLELLIEEVAYRVSNSDKCKAQEECAPISEQV